MFKKLLFLLVFTQVQVFAAKQIIILDIADGGSNSIMINYLFWLTTPNAIAHANMQSQWSGASAGEISALQAGTTIEERYSITVASGTSPTSLKSILNSKYTGRQTYFNNQPGPGTWYGIYYDGGTGWSQ